MRLIDADELAKKWTIASPEPYNTDAVEVLDSIREAPTVDAVVVTRCKDCARWDDDPDTYGADDGPKGKCMKSFETMCADDFCRYGERKDGKDG